MDTPASTLPRVSQGQGKRPLPKPRGNTLPTTPPTNNTTKQTFKTQDSHQKVSTPLVLLSKTKPEASGPKPDKVNLGNKSGHLEVHNRAGRSPSPAKLKVQNHMDRSPSPRAGPKPEPVKKPQQLKANPVSKPTAGSTGLMAQRIAMFENQ